MGTEHPEKIGEYEILGVIGKGGMGRVYKAARPPANAVVAIKVLPDEFLKDEESVERFNREAEAVALLNHPNVVNVIEKNQDGDSIYFVMEYVAGTSLASVLRQRRLSLPEAIRVFKGVCSGLSAAHAKGVVHRDLSPRNILVSEDLSTIKIADFGISRVESISKSHGTLSTTEFSLGSLHYIAPEQARNMVSADHRADIYSLGVLFYEMLTGRVPVGRFSLPSQLNSEVPPDVDPLVLKCLEVDPARRYATVARLLADVRRLEDQLRLGLVREVRGLGNQTSKIFLKSTGGKTVRIALMATGVVAIAAIAFFLTRTISEQTAVPAAGSEPVEVVPQDWPEPPTPPSDALAQAIDSVATPDAVPPADIAQDPVTRESGSAAPEPSAVAATAAAKPPAAPAVDATAQDLKVARDKLGAGLLDAALTDVQLLLEESPGSEYAAQAYLLLGRIWEAKGEIDQARAAFVELESRFGGSGAAIEGAYRSASLLGSGDERTDELEARTALGELAVKYPDSTWAPRALMDKAAIEIHSKLHMVDVTLGRKVPAALVSYRTLVDAYPDHPGAEDGLWYLGDAYTELKEFALAAEALEALGKRFPATRHDVWWTLGQLYDRRLDDDARAVAAYKKVPASSREFDNAQRRIAKLGR